MKIKVLESIAENFERDLEEFVNNGFWLLSDVTTNVIEEEIWYSVVLKK